MWLSHCFDGVSVVFHALGWILIVNSSISKRIVPHILVLSSDCFWRIAQTDRADFQESNLIRRRYIWKNPFCFSSSKSYSIKSAVFTLKIWISSCLTCFFTCDLRRLFYIFRVIRMIIKNRHTKNKTRSWLQLTHKYYYHSSMFV